MAGMAGKASLAHAPLASKSPAPVSLALQDFLPFPVRGALLALFRGVRSKQSARPCFGRLFGDRDPEVFDQLVNASDAMHDCRVVTAPHFRRNRYERSICELSRDPNGNMPDDGDLARAPLTYDLTHGHASHGRDSLYGLPGDGRTARLIGHSLL
jgi:hypothetical protein